MQTGEVGLDPRVRSRAMKEEDLDSGVEPETRPSSTLTYSNIVTTDIKKTFMNTCQISIS